MGDLFRCYKGYTSFTYRLLFACLFPIALFLFTCFVAKTGMDWMIGGLLFSLFTYESMGDFLAYAGLCKEGNRDSSFFEDIDKGKKVILSCDGGGFDSPSAGGVWNDDYSMVF